MIYRFALKGLGAKLLLLGGAMHEMYSADVLNDAANEAEDIEAFSVGGIDDSGIIREDLDLDDIPEFAGPVITRKQRHEFEFDPLDAVKSALVQKPDPTFGQTFGKKEGRKAGKRLQGLLSSSKASGSNDFGDDVVTFEGRQTESPDVVTMVPAWKGSSGSSGLPGLNLGSSGNHNSRSPSDLSDSSRIEQLSSQRTKVLGSSLQDGLNAEEYSPSSTQQLHGEGLTISPTGIASADGIAGHMTVENWRTALSTMSSAAVTWFGRDIAREVAQQTTPKNLNFMRLKHMEGHTLMGIENSSYQSLLTLVAMAHPLKKFSSYIPLETVANSFDIVEFNIRREGLLYMSVADVQTLVNFKGVLSESKLPRNRKASGGSSSGPHVTLYVDDLGAHSQSSYAEQHMVSEYRVPLAKLQEEIEKEYIPEIVAASDRLARFIAGKRYDVTQAQREDVAAEEALQRPKLIEAHKERLAAEEEARRLEAIRAEKVRADREARRKLKAEQKRLAAEEMQRLEEQRLRQDEERLRLEGERLWEQQVGKQPVDLDEDEMLMQHGTLVTRVDERRKQFLKDLSASERRQLGIESVAGELPADKKTGKRVRRRSMDMEAGKQQQYPLSSSQFPLINSQLPLINSQLPLVGSQLGSSSQLASSSISATSSLFAQSKKPGPSVSDLPNSQHGGISTQHGATGTQLGATRSELGKSIPLLASSGNHIKFSESKPRFGTSLFEQDEVDAGVSFEAEKQLLRDFDDSVLPKAIGNPRKGTPRPGKGSKGGSVMTGPTLKDTQKQFSGVSTRSSSMMTSGGGIGTSQGEFGTSQGGFGTSQSGFGTSLPKIDRKRQIEMKRALLAEREDSDDGVVHAGGVEGPRDVNGGAQGLQEEMDAAAALHETLNPKIRKYKAAVASAAELEQQRLWQEQRDAELEANWEADRDLFEPAPVNKSAPKLKVLERRDASAKKEQLVSVPVFAPFPHMSRSRPDGFMGKIQMHFLALPLESIDVHRTVWLTKPSKSKIATWKGEWIEGMIEDPGVYALKDHWEVRLDLGLSPDLTDEDRDRREYRLYRVLIGDLPYVLASMMPEDAIPHDVKARMVDGYQFGVRAFDSQSAQSMEATVTFHKPQSWPSL